MIEKTSISPYQARLFVCSNQALMQVQEAFVRRRSISASRQAAGRSIPAAAAANDAPSIPAKDEDDDQYGQDGYPCRRLSKSSTDTVLSDLV